jgi:hypothetical protein
MRTVYAVALLTIAASALAQSDTNPPIAVLQASLKQLGSPPTTYVTNADGTIACQVRCASLEERQHVRQALLAVAGLARAPWSRPP